VRIGVVSDIHGGYLNLQQALHEMGPIDLLVHAGDGRRDIDRFLTEHELYCQRVAGNCDYAPDLPAESEFYLEGHKVYLTHGHHFGVKQGLIRLGLKGKETNAKLVIFGHTHQPLVDDYYGVILFNPGSLSKERSFGRPSYGIVEADEKSVRPKVCYL
jgi:putative phosphoesterase